MACLWWAAGMSAGRFRRYVAPPDKGVPALSVKAIMYLAPLPGIWEIIPGMVE